MSIVTIIGYLAALASMASFVPQAWKIVRSGQTRGLSSGMYLLTVAAFGLWLTYGVMAQQWPLVVSNAVCFLLSGFILVMTLLPPKAPRRVARRLKE
jgi:MtN3 and saliva related transmembrane protein